MLMARAKDHTNVVQACTSDVIWRSFGRGVSLEGLLNKIETVLQGCEKALADYLQTKRLAFGRFYFVSSAGVPSEN